MSNIWVELQCHYKACQTQQWRSTSIVCIQGQKAFNHRCNCKQRRMALYTPGNRLTVVRCSRAAYQLFPQRIKNLIDDSVVVDDPNQNTASVIEEDSSNGTNRIQQDQTN
eukprot:26466_1